MGKQRRRRKVNNQLDANRRKYSEAVIERALSTERVFMGDFIMRKTDKTVSADNTSLFVFLELG